MTNELNDIDGNSLVVLGPSKCCNAKFGPQPSSQYLVIPWGINDVRIDHNGKVIRRRERPKKNPWHIMTGLLNQPDTWRCDPPMQLSRTRDPIDIIVERWIK